jgi:3-oxoadipate enol-lactonase
MSVLLLNEKTVHYEVLGRGRPVIFLHGWVGSWRYWVPAMQTAAVSFRAYALDLWGFGDTAREPAFYSLEQQVSLLDRFAQEMGFGRVALIGHGLGALVALLFTKTYPRLVDRVMIINAPLESKSVAARLSSPASPGDLAEWLLGKDSLAEPARIDANKTDLAAIIASFNSPEVDDLLPLVSSITTSCLIVHGQNDPAVQTLDEERLLAMPEMVHQVILEGSGHFPMLDESTTFNQLMTDFLSLASGESPRHLQLKEEWKRRFR